MKAMARFLFRHKYSFILVLFLGTPLYIYVQANGLLPCGTISSGNYSLLNPTYYLQATSCNFCYFAKLIQNIVNFLVMVTIPISVTMFAWAGILFFTATGNPKRITRARSIFRGVLIGFIITITGWLVVQIVLQSITRGDFYSANNWVNLDCSEYNSSRERNRDLNSLLTPVVAPPAPGYQYPTGPGTNPTPGGAYEEDSQARTQLQLAGISVNKANCSSASDTNCTSLTGIQTATINQVINLKQACGCDFILTGGTEAGHSGGDSSHSAGYKADISLGSVDAYIQSMMTSIGNRAGDNAPQWRDQYGNTYAKEGDHWDIQVKAAGPLESRPGV